MNDRLMYKQYLCMCSCCTTLSGVSDLEVTVLFYHFMHFLGVCFIREFYELLIEHNTQVLLTLG